MSKISNLKSTNNVCNLFAGSWEPIPHLQTLLSSGYMIPRPIQKRGLDEIGDDKHGLLNGPTASGKTLAILFLVGRSLSIYDNRVAIISVPQTTIAPGFVKLNRLQYPDGTKLDLVPTDLTKANVFSITKIKELHRFLRSRPKGVTADRIGLRIAVCTHATLARTFEQHKLLFRNVDIVIDEGHHVEFSFDEESEFQEEQETINKLGALVKYGLSHDDYGIRFIFSTATFFRANKTTIIPEKFQDKVIRVNIPYDEYLRYCDNLRSFSFDFVFFDHEQTYLNGLRHLFSSAEPEKFIIHIPHRCSSDATPSKTDEVEDIYRILVDSKNPTITYDPASGITIIHNQKSGKICKVINFVDEADRDIKKNTVEFSHSEDNGDSIDGIIALGVFKEGANWRWAKNSIIIGLRNSLVEMIQLIGRILRDAPGKEHVSVYYLLRGGMDVDEESYREDSNRYLKGVFGLMLLMDVLLPATPKLNNKTQGTRDKSIDLLMANDEIGISLREEALSILLDIRAEIGNSGNSMSAEERKAIFVKRMVEMLANIDIEADVEDICDVLWFNFQRYSLISTGQKKNSIREALSGINVDHVDYDAIHEVDELEWLQRFGSGVFEQVNWDQLRSAFGDADDHWDKMYEAYKERYGS